MSLLRSTIWWIGFLFWIVWATSGFLTVAGKHLLHCPQNWVDMTIVIMWATLLAANACMFYCYVINPKNKDKQ